MFAVHVGFLAVMVGAVTVSVAKDPKAWRKLPGSIRGLRSHPFFPRKVVSRLLDYNHKGFHTDDHDPAALREEWRPRSESGRAASHRKPDPPAPGAGTRRG